MSEPTEVSRIRISAEEWLSAWAIADAASVDERSSLGWVLLRGDGTRRSWYATDTNCLMTYEGGADDTVYSLLVARRLIRFAVQAAARDEASELQIGWSAGEVSSLAVVSALGMLRVQPRRLEYSPVDEWLADGDTGSAHVTADSRLLWDLAQAARHRPVPEDAERPWTPLFWLGVDGSQFVIAVDWGEIGRSRYTIDAAGAGDTEMAADLGDFSEVLARLSGEVTITFPDTDDGPLRFQADGRRALLMPIRTSAERLRAPIENILEQGYGPLAVLRDGDGDYPLVRHGTSIYARLVDEEPPRLQIFAVLLEGVQPSPELYTELNDQNVHVGFARLMLVNEQVLAEADLLAHTLDLDEVTTAVDRIRDIANRVTPTLAAVFGGRQRDAHEERWATYRHTVVSAEIAPFTGVDSNVTGVVLNGPEALDPWTLPKSVFVLTASNPQGTTRDDHGNREANARLATNVIRAGGRLIAARGTSADGRYSEEGFLVWGIDVDNATELGRQFGQDAIFGFTDKEQSIISCWDDRIETVPRQSR